jgi:hypothetical protein
MIPSSTTHHADAQQDQAPPSASELISRRIAALGDWRGAALARVRRLIREAEPEVVEQVKWRKPSNPDGVPVWERAGILCTGDAFRDKVKVTFAKGARLDDPARLFNASLEGNAMRAIDLRERDAIDDAAFRALVRAAAALNVAGRPAASRTPARRPRIGR